MVEGEVPNEPEQTAMVPAQQTDPSFDAISKRDGVAVGLAVRCSYDPSTEEGQGFLARANVSQAGEESKLVYYGKSFMMIAWTAIVRTQTKDKKTGVALPVPRPLIRTVIECLDGTEIASASTFVHGDLRAISIAHPNMGVKEPVECMLYKGGGADRVKDVKAAVRRITS